MIQGEEGAKFVFAGLRMRRESSLSHVWQGRLDRRGMAMPGGCEGARPCWGGDDRGVVGLFVIVFWIMRWFFRFEDRFRFLMLKITRPMSFYKPKI